MVWACRIGDVEDAGALAAPAEVTGMPQLWAAVANLGRAGFSG